MKNRLTLLALTMVCYGHMQGSSYLTNYRYWPQIRKDLRNFSPYASLPTQKAKVAAQRAVAAGRLYEDLGVENELSNDYITHLESKIKSAENALQEALRENSYYNENSPYYNKNREDFLRRSIEREKNKIWWHERVPFAGYFLPESHPTYTAERHRYNKESFEKQLNELPEKQKLAREKKQECEARVQELEKKQNTFKTHLQQERNQKRPLYEFFQHPSRNILGEY